MSGDELVDLYDPDDAAGRVVGVAPRSVVRDRNLPHAATSVLLLDERGRVYVHQRTGSKDVYPGMWDCTAGGVVTAGEDPASAARRELAEELGVRVQALEPLPRWWYRDEHTHYLVHPYVATWRGASQDGEIVHQPTEVARGGWLTLDELGDLLSDPERPVVPDGRQALERWLRQRAPT